MSPSEGWEVVLPAVQYQPASHGRSELEEAEGHQLPPVPGKHADEDMDLETGL